MTDINNDKLILYIESDRKAKHFIVSKKSALKFSVYISDIVVNCDVNDEDIINGILSVPIIINEINKHCKTYNVIKYICKYLEIHINDQKVDLKYPPKPLSDKLSTYICQEDSDLLDMIFSDSYKFIDSLDLCRIPKISKEKADKIHSKVYVLYNVVNYLNMDHYSDLISAKIVEMITYIKKSISKELFIHSERGDTYNGNIKDVSQVIGTILGIPCDLTDEDKNQIIDNTYHKSIENEIKIEDLNKMKKVK